MTINGSIGSKAVAVAANESAKTIAANVNAVKADTGVSATARTEVQLSFTAAGSYSLNLRSDNSADQAISFTLSAGNNANAEGLSAAVAAINDQSSKTGVTAAINSTGTKVILTNSSGSDIRLADTTVANGGDVTVEKLDATGTLVGAAVTLTSDATANNSIASGYITLDSEKSFAIDNSTAVSTDAFADASATLVKVCLLYTSPSPRD